VAPDLAADHPDAERAPDIPERGAARPRRGREPAAPARVLSVHAHPDDQEFTVGGTLAKWARAGSEIVTVCLTRGEAGSNAGTPPDLTPEALATIRETEQREACRLLGVREVVFLGYADGVLEPSLALRRDLTRLIRHYRPDAVICGDPTVRVAAGMALDAVFPSAGTRFIFPELLTDGLAPHHVRTVFVHGSLRPDTFIDIGPVLEVKLAALRAHKSQLGDWDPTEMVAQWAREQGARRGLAAAEAYRRMVLDGP
jgi:LmbE family N-acetylglucosaminyl deacetylase